MLMFVSVFVVDPHFSDADLRSCFSGAVEMREQRDATSSNS